MLSVTQVNQFNRNGYLLGPRVITAEEVGILQEEMERVIRDRGRKDVPQPPSIRNLTGRDDEPVWQILNIWQASDPFLRLASNPTIAQEIGQLLAANELRLWHDQIQYKPAGIGGVTIWHQDWPYWDILDAPHQVTAWVALDDVDEENGCMSMVPGSHLWGDNSQYLFSLPPDFTALPREYEGRPIEIRPCPVKAGHVHYHHALTWHASNRNRSGRKRRAIALHLMSDQTRYKSTGHHPMKHYATVPDGAMLEGDHFPLVWSAESLAAHRGRSPLGL